jgi:hypothetical protein
MTEVTRKLARLKKQLRVAKDALLDLATPQIDRYPSSNETARLALEQIEAGVGAQPPESDLGPAKPGSPAPATLEKESARPLESYREQRDSYDRQCARTAEVERDLLVANEALAEVGRRAVDLTKERDSLRAHIDAIRAVVSYSG